MSGGISTQMSHDLNSNEVGIHSKNWSINFSPALTSFGKNNRVIKLGLNISETNYYASSQTTNDTSSYNNEFSSIGCFAQFDKWISLDSKGKIFFSSGSRINIGASGNAFNQFSNYYSNGNVERSVGARGDIHFGIEYLKSTRWFWQFEFTPFSLSAYYNWRFGTHLPVIPEQRYWTVNAGLSSFGAGFSFVYLFGKKASLLN